MGTDQGIFESDKGYERRLTREANKAFIDAQKKAENDASKNRQDRVLDSIFGGFFSGIIIKIIIGLLIGLAVHFFARPDGIDLIHNIGAGVILAFFGKYVLKFIFR